MEPGDVVGKYRILRKLEELGHGQAYLARHQDQDRMCLLKRVPEEVLSGALRETLERIGKTKHPALVAIVETLEEGRWVGYELFSGRTFSPSAGQRTPLDFFVPLLEGLKTLHDQGIAHGGIRPSSVVVTATGEGRWIDFGFAYAPVDKPEAAHLREAVKFMAPEQRRGKPAGLAADVYSMGMLIRYGLTGAAPVEGVPTEPIAGISPKTSEVLSEMLAEEPSKRLKSVGEVLSRLGEEKRIDVARKRRLYSWLGSAAAAALLGVFIFLGSRPQPKPAQPAPTESTARTLQEQGDAALARGDPARALMLFEEAGRVGDSEEIRGKIRGAQKELQRREARGAFEAVLAKVDQRAPAGDIADACREFLKRHPQFEEEAAVSAILKLAERAAERASAAPRPAVEPEPRVLEPRAAPPVAEKPTAGLKAEELVAAGNFAGARAELLRVLGTPEGLGAARLLSEVLLQENRWEQAFSGKDMERFLVVTLDGSGAQISGGQIAAWGRGTDPAMLKLKGPTERISGISVRFQIDEPFSDAAGLGIVFDAKGKNTYRQLVMGPRGAGLRVRKKGDWQVLGTADARAEPGGWHRLTMVREGPSIVALADGLLVYFGSSPDASFGGARIVLEDCRGRIAEVALRR